MRRSTSTMEAPTAMPMSTQRRSPNTPVGCDSHPLRYPALHVAGDAPWL
uniref:Uncharacterized protein n=1 Tax=Arundo donax TaxID=35708 RepID=A0A0A9EFA1_ARUDO